jgi:hypothetical protein
MMLNKWKTPMEGLFQKVEVEEPSAQKHGNKILLQ